MTPGAGRAITFGYDVTERETLRSAAETGEQRLGRVVRSCIGGERGQIDPNEVFSVALRRALAALHCQKGFLHVWDDLSGMMKLEAHVGLTPGAEVSPHGSC